MAPIEVLLPACTLHEMDSSDTCASRLWKRRKSMPATTSHGLLDCSDALFAKVRFDASFEYNEFSCENENDSSRANVATVNLLPYKSPSAAYFDGCDDGFGLTPIVDRNNGQSFLPPSQQESFQDSASSIESSTTSSTFAMPDAARAASKRLSRTIQYSYDTLTSRCEDSLPLENFPRTFEKLSNIFMNGKMWELSQDVQGCREVQKALDDCKGFQDFESVAVQLTGHVWDAMRCPHANHVLRKVVQTAPASCLDFIIQEIVQEGAGDVKQFVSHRYGCRIVEEILRVCDPMQLHGIMGHLLTEAGALCTHMYGNFVMKAFLQRASFMQRQELVKILLDNAVTMGTNFYACAVLSEVLQNSDDLGRALAFALVRTPGLLSAMASHKHGKAAVEAVLLMLKGPERQAAVNALTLPPLKVAKAPKATKNQRS